MSVTALDSSDVEYKINYCRLLSELCRKSPDGHATALTICEQLKVELCTVELGLQYFRFRSGGGLL